MSDERKCPRCRLDLSRVEPEFGQNQEERLQGRTVRKGPRLAVVPTVEEVDGKPVERWRPAPPDEAR